MGLPLIICLKPPNSIDFLVFFLENMGRLPECFYTAPTDSSPFSRLWWCTSTRTSTEHITGNMLKVTMTKDSSKPPLRPLPIHNNVGRKMDPEGKLGVGPPSVSKPHVLVHGAFIIECSYLPPLTAASNQQRGRLRVPLPHHPLRSAGSTTPWEVVVSTVELPP